MKDSLDYTEEELNELNVDELELLLNDADSKMRMFNTRQLVEKTLINSLYGSLANKWFPLFNEEIARAITGNGRFFIQKLADYIETELQKMLPWEKKYIIYGDTDSVVGDTVVTTSRGDVKIENLYDMLSGNIEIRGDDNFIKHVTSQIKAASVSRSMMLENKNITYVMKHKVKKRMFKIKCAGDEVVVTEDHSIIVNRHGKLTSVKPMRIIKGDKLIKIGSNLSEL